MNAKLWNTAIGVLFLASLAATTSLQNAEAGLIPTVTANIFLCSGVLLLQRHRLNQSLSLHPVDILHSLSGAMYGAFLGFSTFNMAAILTTEPPLSLFAIQWGLLWTGVLLLLIFYWRTLQNGYTTPSRYFTVSGGINIVSVLTGITLFIWKSLHIQPGFNDLMFSGRAASVQAAETAFAAGILLSLPIFLIGLWKRDT